VGIYALGEQASIAPLVTTSFGLLSKHSSVPHKVSLCSSLGFSSKLNLLFLLINIRRYEFPKDSWGFYEVPMVEPCVDAEMDAGDKQLFEHKPSDPFSFHFYDKNVTSEANKESTGTNPRLINTATLTGTSQLRYSHPPPFAGIHYEARIA
jgi:hypothetical protein